MILLCILLPLRQDFFYNLSLTNFVPKRDDQEKLALTLKTSAELLHDCILHIFRAFLRNILNKF